MVLKKHLFAYEDRPVESVNLDSGDKEYNKN